MKESKAMAFVNAYGVLGALENLCELDDKAKAIVKEIKKPISLCFDVTDGPCVTYHFTSQGCKLEDGSDHCTCKMNFSSPERFNALIDDGKPGTPAKGLVQVLKFLTGPFTKLTDRLTEVLMPSEDAMKDEAFFKENTLMTFYTIANTISALANNDSISQLSASNTPDGVVIFGIKDVCDASLKVENHKFSTYKNQKLDNPRAVMEFCDIKLANDLFNGKVNAIAEMCRGKIYMAGMMNMVDNINRILDRVGVYLA